MPGNFIAASRAHWGWPGVEGRSRQAGA
jgi:hypothetical protein